MSQEGIKQPTLEEIVGKLISLHHELGNFQIFMANKTRPANWNHEDVQIIGGVLEMIEEETERMRKIAKDRNLDIIVLQSLKQAGFTPDKKPEA